MKRLNLKNNEGEKKEQSDLSFILEHLEINKFKLDEESVIQTELMFKASRLFSKAKDATLRAKNRLEIVEFEISQEIRKNPKNYGLKKDTDVVVFKAVKATEEYKKAFNVYCFVKQKEDEYSLLLDNVRSRGYSIKVLVELWLNNYYVDTTNYTTRKRKAKRLPDE